MGSKLCNMRVILALALLAASARALPTPNDVVPEFIASEPEVPKAVKQAVEACQVITQEQVCEDLDAKACIAEGAGISGRCKTCAECIARGMHTDVNGLFAKLQAGQELVQAEPEVPKAVKQAVEACQVINQEQVCEDLDAKACIAEGAGISGRCKTCAECIARGMHTD